MMLVISEFQQMCVINIPPNEELAVGKEILPGKSFKSLEKLLLIVNSLKSRFLLPRKSGANAHAQGFLLVQVRDMIMQRKNPVIAELKLHGHIFFSSPEIPPINIEAIA